MGRGTFVLYDQLARANRGEALLTVVSIRRIDLLLA
jgi:hypothetical protein